jgi:inhibitor of KinA sporulation pathway (predicted exonuclease)
MFTKLALLLNMKIFTLKNLNFLYYIRSMDIDFSSFYKLGSIMSPSFIINRDLRKLYPIYKKFLTGKKHKTLNDIKKMKKVLRSVLANNKDFQTRLKLFFENKYITKKSFNFIQKKIFFYKF